MAATIRCGPPGTLQGGPAVPVNPAARRARARLMAHRRWHPGDDLDALTVQCYHELEQTNSDAGVDDWVARAPRMTPAQAARIGALWWSAPGCDPREPATRTV